VIVQSTVPANPEQPLVVDLSEALPICTYAHSFANIKSACSSPHVISVSKLNLYIVDSTVVFWTPEVQVGERAAFQLSLTAPRNTTISALPIAELNVLFDEGVKPVVVRHLSQNLEDAVRTVDLGHVGPSDVEEHVENGPELQACLRWKPGDVVIFTGTMSSNVPGSFKVILSRRMILEFTGCFRFRNWF
jgi:hypothetical protein